VAGRVSRSDREEKGKKWKVGRLEKERSAYFETRQLKLTKCIIFCQLRTKKDRNERKRTIKEDFLYIVLLMKGHYRAEQAEKTQRKIEM